MKATVDTEFFGIPLALRFSEARGADAEFLGGPWIRPAPDWRTLPSALVQPLAPEFIEHLRAHPIARGLGARLDGGRDMKIRMPDLKRASTLWSVRALSGESVQASFVAKVLAEILPDARILAGPGRDHVRFRIRDLSDGPAGHRSHDGPVLPMEIIKAAHPGFVIAKDRARRSLSIPAGARVVALTVPFGLGPEAVQKLIEAIVGRSAARILIVSFVADGRLGLKNARRNYRAIGGADWSNPKRRPNLIGSAWWPGVRDKDRDWIVYNETFGRMPYIYAAADFAVLSGPGNMFEPLRAGTPVSVPSVVEDYDPAVWREMKSGARASGGGFEYANASELEAQIKSSFRGDPRARVRLRDESAALDRLLTALNELL